MDIIESKYASPSYRNLVISFIVLCILFILGAIYMEGLGDEDPSFMDYVISFDIVGGFLVIMLPIFFAYNIRVQTFDGDMITLIEYHFLLPSMLQINKQFTWDDVLAWDETPYLEDVDGDDPFSIDLLIQDGDTIRLYRTPGSWILVDNKTLRFADFKQQIKPYLDKTPHDPDRIEAYSYDTTVLGYTMRYLAIVLLLASLLAMGAGGPSLAVMGFFFSFGMFPFAQKQIKNGEKIRKRRALIEKERKVQNDKQVQ